MQEYANAGLIDQLSLHFWDQDDEFGTDGYHCMVAGGYGQVPIALARGYNVQDALNVQCGVAVDEISIANVSAPDHPSDGMVHIKCRDGSVRECDAVVVTVPLGVLKANAIKFTPELPAWKQDAIDKLGYGWFNKTVLVFPRRFWNANVDSFGSLGPQYDSPNPPTFENIIRGEFFLFWYFIFAPFDFI